MTLGYATDASGREAPLIDTIAPVRIRDRADDDVRAAMAAVGARENRERIASDIGLAGARAVSRWDEVAEAVGRHQAALQAAQLYKAQPIVTKTAEQKHDDPTDHHAAARKAFRQVAERERVRDELPQTLEHLDAIEQRHGSLDVIETRKRWHDQLAANPADAAPRIATELAGEINNRTTLPPLENLATDFLVRNKVSDEEWPVMERYLRETPSTGDKSADLALAHGYASFATAADIEDEHTRDVIASMRSQGGPQMYLAALEVEDFAQSHPNLKRYGPTWNRMQELLETRKVQNLDQAYVMALRR